MEYEREGDQYEMIITEALGSALGDWATVIGKEITGV